MIEDKLKKARNGKKLFDKRIKLNQTEMLIILPHSTDDELKEWTLHHISELQKQKKYEHTVVVSDEEYELIDNELLDVRSVLLSFSEIIDVVQYLSLEKKIIGSFFDNRFYIVSLDGEIGNFELRGIKDAGYCGLEALIKKWIFDFEGKL